MTSRSAAEPAAGRVTVAVFGKHPGWNDHLDDIGMTNEALVELKRFLYLDGIGANVDAGAWERLAPERRAPGYGHDWLWRAPEVLVAGRMWSSSDGKGRDRYPMVAAVQAPGTPLPLLVERAMPVLKDLEAECRAEQEAGGVVAAVERARGVLESAFEGSPGETASTGGFPTGEELAALCFHPDMGEDGGGCARLMYVLRRDLAEALSSCRTAWRPAGRKPCNMRVPGCAESPACFALWAGFFYALMQTAVPLFMIRRDDGGWLDLVAGVPTAASLACLQASREGLPFVTDIPFEVDEATIAWATGVLETWQAGGIDWTPVAQTLAGAGRPASAWPSLGSRLKRLIGIGRQD